MSSIKIIWLVLMIFVELTCPVFVFSQQVTSIPVPVLPETSSFKQLLPSVFDSIVNKPKWILASLAEDQCKLWTSPFSIKTKDLKFWIPVLTATTVSIIYDEEIYSAVKDFQNSHDWVSDISPVITWGGEDAFVLSAGTLFYLSGVLSGKEKIKQTGLIALQTWVNAGIVVQVGKLIFGRQRPSFEDGEDRWHGFPASLNKFKDEPSPKYDAFPSGHTIEVWALAAVIAEQYKDIKIVPVISYSLATGVGLSRITEDTHWLSDVIMGAALGYSIGKFMVRERKDTRWTILPRASGNKAEIIAVYQF
jgi:membrane-associated phospholipid phosphatase